MLAGTNTVRNSALSPTFAAAHAAQQYSLCPSSRRSKLTQPQPSPCHWTSPPPSSSSHASPASSPPVQPAEVTQAGLPLSRPCASPRRVPQLAPRRLPFPRGSDAKLCLSLSHTLPARHYTSQG
jgi:hypothetical protein